MLIVEDLGEEYELDWPVALFRSEAQAISAATDRFNDYADLLLREAFTEETPANEFATKALWQNWGETPAESTAPRDFINALAIDAHKLPTVALASPYWVQRNGLNLIPQRLPKRSFREDWVHVIQDLINAGYFSLVAGEACVDGLTDNEVFSNLSRQIERRIGVPDLWPLPSEAEGVGDDLLFTMVEVFHDLAARPRRRTEHDYGQCGWHHSDQVRKPGQGVYRWRVNQLLQRHQHKLRLAEEGEDVGRLVRNFTDPRAELLVEVTNSDDAPNKASTEHAIALFRKRGATREDKRSACVALALVLEDRRKMLKKSLVNKDEAMLFQIANEFDVRHRNGKQYDDLGDEFQDWVFWTYLASVELTNRILTRQG